MKIWIWVLVVLFSILSLSFSNEKIGYRPPHFNHFVSGVHFEPYWNKMDSNTTRIVNSNLTELENRDNIKVVVMFSKSTPDGIAETERLAVDKFESLYQKGYMILVHFIIIEDALRLHLYSSKTNLLPQEEITRLENECSDIMEERKPNLQNLSQLCLYLIDELLLYLSQENHLNPVERFFKHFQYVFLNFIRSVIFPVIMVITLVAVLLVLAIIGKGFKIHPVLIVIIGAVALLHILKVLPDGLALISYAVIGLIAFASNFNTYKQ